jgi:hypothetical protein
MPAGHGRRSLAHDGKVYALWDYYQALIFRRLALLRIGKCVEVRVVHRGLRRKVSLKSRSIRRRGTPTPAVTSADHCRWQRPHPRPSPGGRGEPIRRQGVWRAAPLGCQLLFTYALPLPKGEGSLTGCAGRSGRLAPVLMPAFLFTDYAPPRPPGEGRGEGSCRRRREVADRVSARQGSGNRLCG